MTSGLVLIPVIFGIGMIFYNSRNPVGWVLFIGGIGLLLRSLRGSREG